MAKRYYKVADLIFSICLGDSDKLVEQIANYAPFEIAENEALASSLLFELDVRPWGDEAEALASSDKSSSCFASFEEEDKIITLYKTKDCALEDASSKSISDYRFHFFSKISRHENLGVLNVTENFSKAVLWAKGSVWARQFSLNNSLMMVYAFAGADKEVLLEHASVIKLCNSGSSCGYCFLGKSGTGKSTHSSLWLKNIAGTSLLNDDNPAIRLNREGVACVYGTPWSGKTPCYKNEFVKLGGFVSLEQAPFNKIEKLSLIEAYAALLPTFSNLKWERTVADGINNTITELIKKVQVFHLKCLPDADAAFVSYKALTGREAEERIAEENKRKTAKGYEVFDAVAELVDEDKTVKITVRGNSMLPFIFNGRDQVELKRQSSYVVGDIVLARISDRFVLHRIWGFEGENVILQGDGNPRYVKEKLPKTDIIAKVVAIYFNGKKKLTDAPWQKFKYMIWGKLVPFRRILLGVYRRLPYYRKYMKIVNERD